MRRCIYCGTAEDLSDSDIIPDALTASRIINKCVCHVEHNSGMTEKFESEVVEKLAFLLNHLDIKSKKSNHYPTYEADYDIEGIRYHDKKVFKDYDFINKKILRSKDKAFVFGPYEKIEQIAKSKGMSKADIEQIDMNSQMIKSYIPLNYDVFFSEAMHLQCYIMSPKSKYINYNLFVLEIFNILDKGVEGIHGGNQDVVEFVIEQLQDLLSTDVIHKRGLKRFVEDNIENAEIRINKENIDESSIFYYYILYKLGQSDIQNAFCGIFMRFVVYRLLLIFIRKKR